MIVDRAEVFHGNGSCVALLYILNFIGLSTAVAPLHGSMPAFVLGNFFMSLTMRIDTNDEVIATQR